eukprot:1294997-Lingulodinium_polyedra.AAC.1
MPRPDTDVIYGMINRSNLPDHEHGWTRQLAEQQRRAGKAADALERCISSLGSRVQQRLAATEQDEMDVE